MSNIKLSPKHGVNPTIPVCFFCGGEKNEVALLGELKDDVKAPKHMCMDYMPCDKCADAFKQGVLLVGITAVQPKDNRPPIQDGAYPTGSHMVVADALIERIFSPESVNQVLEARRALVPEKLLEAIQRANAEITQEGGQTHE